ncbi:hypothetical protein Dimus_000851 [Dionaea muscipula]
MCKSTRENGVWWIGSGENRRRDDDEAAPEEEAEEEEERNKDDFDWEAVIDEVAIAEGESGSGEKFYDAEEEAQGSPDLHDETPAEAPPSSVQQKNKGIAGVDPSGPTGRDAEFLKFQAEFERKRANRRRDDDMDNPEEEAEKEDEGNKDGFDWEAVIDEAAVEGESGSGDKFYDAEDKEQDSPAENEEISAAVPQCSAQQKEQGTLGVDPSCPTGRIPEVEMTRLQAEFERKRANRFLADLEKAKAENARLLALLHQAQSKPHP